MVSYCGEVIAVKDLQLKAPSVELEDNDFAGSQLVLPAEPTPAPPQHDLPIEL